MSSEWIFPHSTCERTLASSRIVQPISFGMNMLNAVLLLRSAAFAPDAETSHAIGSFDVFEIMHMMSHAVHFDRNLHEIGIHFCGYLMAAMVYQALTKETGYVFTSHNKLLLASMIFVDLIVFSTVRNVYSIATGLSVMAVTVAQFSPKLNKKKKNLLKVLIAGTSVLFGMFVIEKKFCPTFLKHNFEYHPYVVETWGIILFQLLAHFISVRDFHRSSKI